MTKNNKNIHIISLSQNRCTYLRTDTDDKGSVYKLENFTIKRFLLYQKLSGNRFNFNHLLLPKKISLKGLRIESSYVLQTPLLSHLQSTPFTFRDFIRLFHDIANGILALHKAGLVHGDIAPRNIYVDGAGHYLLGDFSETKVAKKEEDYFVDQQLFATMLLELLAGGRESKLFHEKEARYFIDSEYLSSLLKHIQRASFKENKRHFRGFHSFVNSTSSLFTNLEIFENEVISFDAANKSFFQNRTETIVITKQNKYIYCLALGACFLLLVLANSLSSPKKTRGIPHFATSSPVPKEEQLIIDCSHSNASSLVEFLPSQDTFDSITTVYGEDNEFQDISEFAELQNLRELYLSANNIHSLNSADFQKLKIMILSDNDLQELYLQSPSLSFLDLSGNKNFSDVTSLSNLSSLNTLILTDTAVSSLDISFLQKQLPNCKIIY